MRRMLMSRCSLEKPSSEERCLRTRSPSSIVTGRPPASRNFVISTLAIVDLPEPESPVKKIVTPCLWRGGKLRGHFPNKFGEKKKNGECTPVLLRFSRG